MSMSEKWKSWNQEGCGFLGDKTMELLSIIGSQQNIAYQIHCYWMEKECSSIFQQTDLCHLSTRVLLYLWQELLYCWSFILEARRNRYPSLAACSWCISKLPGYYNTYTWYWCVYFAYYNVDNRSQDLHQDKKAEQLQVDRCREGA